MRRRTWLFLVIFSAGLVDMSPLFAADPYVPAVLEPWRAWVLERHHDRNCPPQYNDGAIR